MPFFKFSHLTGRLTENNRLIPLNPIKPIPLESAEIPVIKYDTIKTQAVKSAPATGTQKTNSEYGRLHPKNHALMKTLQADLEAPVFLARGAPDKILFGITFALVVGGVLESLRFLVRKANTSG
ncbi:uncharacterized protein LOC127278363 [Leptopilina boulardi]|uniref:uncharacterized protein LOC127278363 n=1 Tax=Leptopilina boulardi TaxID=63433 RepID=UPI0021F66797|nr:uncharacterized protein LOC127278363 [Leptopilina boulardi]